MSAGLRGLSTAALTVPALLAARARHQPDRMALAAGSRSVTFAEWEAGSTALARALLDRGLSRGDRVGLVFGTRHWIDFAIAFCAVHKAGGVAVPVSERLAPAQRRFILSHCGATGVVRGSDLATDDCPQWTVTASDGLPGPLESLARPTDLAQIVYTSGTTGQPKGVSASHANLTFGCTTGEKRRKLAHSDHFVHAFPVGSNACQTALMTALDAKPAGVAMARFTPGHLGRVIEEHRAGTVFLVPAMAVETISAEIQKRFDVTSVALVGASAAALPPAVAVGLTKTFANATVVNTYTSTEAAPAQTTMVFDPRRPAALGRPASADDVKIGDAEGNPVPAGEIGEVWLRSPTIPRAYYGDAAATADVFRGHWVRMGDLGRLDPDGYLYLVDRESDVLKSGAEKVSTLQVEAALYESPDILEAAVFGVPHPVLGTAITASVVPRGDLVLSDLRAFLADRLAAHQLPASIHVRESLPRNDTGKVLKHVLRAELVAETEGS